MRKEILALIASAFSLLTITTAIAQHSDHDHDYEQEQEKRQKYTCTMHPEVVTDHPGDCPKCGMKLVPVKQEKRRTSNSDKSRAGIKRATSSSDHLVHDGAEMAMSHNHYGGHETHTPSHEGNEMHVEMHSSIDVADLIGREGAVT